MVWEDEIRRDRRPPVGSWTLELEIETLARRPDDWIRRWTPCPGSSLVVTDQGSAAPSWSERLAQFECTPFTARAGDGDIERDVYRRAGRGPTVIVIHEMPTITEKTLRLGDLLWERGFSVALPLLLGTPSVAADGPMLRSGFVKLCTAREFEALRAGRTSPIVTWLRALVDHEHDPRRGPSVGILGMCFSGGFALATAMNPKVGAAVLGHPALPLPFWFDRLPDLGMTPADLDAVRQRVGEGQCLRTVRYAWDVKSPAARRDRLVCEFPAIEHVEIPSRNPNRHSVFGAALDADDRTPQGLALRSALAGTVAFLERQLGVAQPGVAQPGVAQPGGPGEGVES